MVHGAVSPERDMKLKTYCAAGTTVSTEVYTASVFICTCKCAMLQRAQSAWKNVKHKQHRSTGARHLASLDAESAVLSSSDCLPAS